MSDFKIEKGLPVPERRQLKYPFAELEVGDSFFVPGKQVGQITHNYRRYPDKLFTSRTENGGIRVWRLK